MLASKPVISSTNLHLPKVNKGGNRNRFRQSPITPTTSTNLAENVTALKEKYTDYAMWLKASSRQNREPIFTHELLKNSLCQMGIDSTQAEQLVSTCSWYVYQFHKELNSESSGPIDQSIAIETKKPSQSTKKPTKKLRAVKSKKATLVRENSVESTATINSIIKGYRSNPNKFELIFVRLFFFFFVYLDNTISPGLTSPTRSKFSVLPAIHSQDPSLSPRSRHVDFDRELHEQQLQNKQKSSHWRSAISKARILPKLRRTETESSVNDLTPGETTPIESEPSSPFERNTQRTGSNARQTRSILRKQYSSCSSVTSTNLSYRRNRNRLLTPTPTIIDEVPLGTRSQRLFGGSECFAEIMNELEEQKSN